MTPLLDLYLEMQGDLVWVHCMEVFSCPLCYKCFLALKIVEVINHH